MAAAATRASNLRTLRGILSELRHNTPSHKIGETPMARYVLDQYRKFKTTGNQVCLAEGEMAYVADTYLCYLQSQRKYQEIVNTYKGKGERSVKATADIVGFKLPQDPK